MNKTLKQSTDVRNESTDTANKIYRVICELSRQLDDQRARVHSVRELFRDDVEVLRMKLRDYCEKLMFADPVNFGRKAEDLLWKKSYYEVVATVKHLHRKRDWEGGDSSLIYLHLQSGLGRYHHLIMRLQSHYKLDLRGSVDAPLTVPDRGLTKDKSPWSMLAVELGGLEWAQQAVVRCLIYLGDLSRYLVELAPNRFDPIQAHRYYYQALSLKPDYGTPHNQLATMMLGMNYNLDSAYHYMRSICCKQKFEGAEMNYENLFDKNNDAMKELTKQRGNRNGSGPGCGDGDQLSTATLPVKSVLTTFVHITYCLFYDKPFAHADLYSKMMRELEPCISALKAITLSANSQNQQMSQRQVATQTTANLTMVSDHPESLDEYMLFKMVVMMIICVQRLKEKGSALLNLGMTWCLSLCCFAVDLAASRLCLVMGGVPRAEPPQSATSKAKRRRRRRLPMSDDEEDEFDEYGYSSGSDPGEEELIYDQCNNDESPEADEDCKDAKGNLSGMSDRGMKPWTHPMVTENKYFQQIHALSAQGYILQTVKVIFDWWMESKFSMKRNGVISSTVDSLITNFVCLMNQLAGVPNLKTVSNHLEEGCVNEEDIISTPLPEDISLKGLTGFKLCQSKITWAKFTNNTLYPKQQTYVRICKLLAYGVALSKTSESPVCYSELREWFYPKVKVHQNVSSNGTHNGSTVTVNGSSNSTSEAIVTNGISKNNQVKENGDKQLMASMAAMWLKSEVSHLEALACKPDLPAYLVLDASVLLQHVGLVRRLAQAKRFVLIVPNCAVACLDAEKGRPGSGRVRETMRWIEAQVRHGSRFVRIQRPNEHAPIPFIKYPKKKDKDACMFIEMVECAYYLSTQSTGDKNAGLVTLLTGNSGFTSSGDRPGGFSPSGVAKAASVSLEHVEQFYAKWKSNGSSAAQPCGSSSAAAGQSSSASSSTTVAVNRSGNNNHQQSALANGSNG